MKKLLLLIVLAFSIFQTAKAETEPNDNPLQANLLVLDSTQFGTLSGVDVDDWFVLAVPQGGILTFTLHKTGGGNGRMYLLDADKVGFPEISNLYLGYNDSPPEGWILSYPLLPGNYYVHFLRYDPSVTYSIKPSLALSSFGQDIEPNHVSADAQVFSPTGTVGGTLRYYRPNDGTDVTDWFKMVVPQGGILNLKIHKKGPGNTWFHLLDAENLILPEISNYYTGYGESPTEGWSWSIPVLAGTYFFQVSGGEYWLDYQLEASLVAPTYAEDTEPNDDFSEAGNFPVNGSVSGTLRYYGPDEGWDLKDWYKMTVLQGGILNLKIHKTGPGNTWIRMRDAEIPTFPEVSNFYTGYGQSPVEGWKWSFPTLAGDYYFQVGEGEYTVDYKIEAALAAPNWGEDTEPNDSLNVAQNFLLNETIGGLMGYYRPGFGYDNWDWFVVNTSENGLLSFQISKIEFQNGNVHLRNETAEIGTIYLGFSDQNTTFSKLVPAGIYYLGFEKFSGDFQYKVVSSLLPTTVANFTFAQTGNVFAFENTTLHPASFLWQFDDGATATTVNAYHEYNAPGNFDVCLIATNVAGADTICQELIMPGVARVLPNRAGNIGDATIEVFGGGLDTNYVVKIMQGTTTVATSVFTGFAGKSSIFVRFDLRNKPVGTYDLRIEKPGGPSYTVPGGFTIETGIAADPWVSISGRNRILFNTWTTYTVNYGNRGNVDAQTVPIWLAFSNNPGLEVEFVNVRVFDWDTLGGEPPAEGMFVDLDSLFGEPAPSRIYPLLFARIQAGSTHSMTIRVKTSSTLKINAWAEKPWFQSPINQNKMECVGDALAAAPPELNLTDKVECVKILTAVIFTKIDESYEWELHKGYIKTKPNFFTTFIKSLRVASKICGVSSAEDREKIGNWVMHLFVNRHLNGAGTPAIVSYAADDRDGEKCSVEFKPQNPSSSTLTAVNSLDPNEKSGPAGFGLKNHQAGTMNFPYTIHFENKADATAPAHTVVVTDTLDKAKFDLNSFSFGLVNIGDSIVQPDPGLREFVLDKNLDELGVTARIQGKLDAQTGIVEWTFRSLDAVTLAEVEDPDLGFLPPNVNAPAGQGSVSFFIRLKNAPQNAEEIRNRASIVFDANAPIITDEHLVTFDLVAPESAVLPLPSTTQEEQFPVAWAGTDAGSGLQFFNVYVSENGAADTLWLARTTTASAIFNGKTGNSYRFFSIAVDNAGNAELAPATPDAEISILVGTDNPLNGSGLRVFPNPAKERIVFLFETMVSGSLTFSRLDGTVIFIENLRDDQQHEFSVIGLPAGVYYWNWADVDGSQRASGKILVAH
ncbi:MAG: PKD domain-containing protein [Saprospiraceae bacterium]|nr:PKD domain-containing protein [Saprospiraceae bacterium]